MEKETFGYKFDTAFLWELEEYLNKRPFKEVDTILVKCFEEVGDKSSVYTQQALDLISNYLLTCPRGEVAPIIKKLLDGENVKKFKVLPKDEEDKKKGIPDFEPDFKYTPPPPPTPKARPLQDVSIGHVGAGPCKADPIYGC